MHDFANLLITPLFLFANSSMTSSDNTVKVAVVTAIGVVIAAGITAFASTFQRRGHSTQPPVPVPVNPNDFSRDYVNGLVHDRRTLNKLQAKYAYLREACLERGLDPDDLIREQERRP